MYTCLQNLHQGSKYVDEYTSKFLTFLAWNSLIETEDQVILRFIGGLNKIQCIWEISRDLKRQLMATLLLENCALHRTIALVVGSMVIASQLVRRTNEVYFWRRRFMMKKISIPKSVREAQSR